MSARLGVGFIGSGFNAKFHMLGWREQAVAPATQFNKVPAMGLPDEQAGDAGRQLPDEHPIVVDQDFPVLQLDGVARAVRRADCEV